MKEDIKKDYSTKQVEKDKNSNLTDQTNSAKSGTRVTINEDAGDAQAAFDKL